MDKLCYLLRCFLLVWLPSGDVEVVVVKAMEDEEEDEGSGAKAGFSSNASLLFAESCFGRAGSGEETATSFEEVVVTRRRARGVWDVASY